MDEARPVILLDEALAAVDAALTGAAPAAETVPVREALGRVLAADQHSRLDLPPFDKSAMDGYAVLPGDEREAYRLLETVAAGQTPTARLEPGTAVKVMTGAPVPDGAGKVIIREVTDEAGETVRVRRHDASDNICRQGEDIRAGDPVLQAGRALDALDAANLVSCGITEVPVAARLRMAILSTGDEIVDDPAALRPGRIMNANGPMLAGLAAAHGLTVVAEQSVPDAPEPTVAALRGAMAAADIVVLSGGVSVGEYDYVLAAFEQAGLDVHFARIAVKPGKPTVFATSGGRVVFGLPGNPVSVCVMFHLFVLRAAARLCGAPPPLRTVHLPLAAGYRRRKANREQFVPARRRADGTLEPLEYHGSAHLLAMREADGFLRVPIGVVELAAGDVAGFLPIRRARA